MVTMVARRLLLLIQLSPDSNLGQLGDRSDEYFWAKPPRPKAPMPQSPNAPMSPPNISAWNILFLDSRKVWCLFDETAPRFEPGVAGWGLQMEPLFHAAPCMLQYIEERHVKSQSSGWHWQRSWNTCPKSRRLWTPFWRSLQTGSMLTSWKLGWSIKPDPI